MELSCFQQITLYWRAGGSHFPFEFGRQAGSSPAGKGVRFVITHMANRLGFFYTAQARAGELQPVVSRYWPARFLTVRLLPVERCAPAMGLHGFPSIGEPEFRTRVAAV